MQRRYSRLSRSEEKRNIRRAYLFGFLTIALIFVFIFLGLPTVAKFAGFLTELRKSSEAPEVADTTPPAPPRLDPLPEATNNLGVEIKGSTEPGASVVLFLNNKKEEVLANRDGEFSYSFSLISGDNSISAVARDTSGNESQETKTYKITFDNEPPSLEISVPDAGSEFYGSKQRQIIIKGITEGGAKLNVNERLVVVEADGSFSYLVSLTEGENQFTIKASDKAGNAKEQSLTLHFTP